MCRTNTVPLSTVEGFVGDSTTAGGEGRGRGGGGGGGGEEVWPPPYMCVRMVMMGRGREEEEEEDFKHLVSLIIWSSWFITWGTGDYGTALKKTFQMSPSCLLDAKVSSFVGRRLCKRSRAQTRSFSAVQCLYL